MMMILIHNQFSNLYICVFESENNIQLNRVLISSVATPLQLRPTLIGATPLHHRLTTFFDGSSFNMFTLKYAR